MNKQILFASALAVLGLTSCEKGLDDGGDYMSPTATGQVTNSECNRGTVLLLHRLVM